MNMDVILVKRFFSPEQAGYFARAGTIGRAVVFLPMPIALAMFPKVVSSGTVSRQNWNMLVKAMVFAAIMIAMAVGAGSLLPGLALRLMYNEKAPTPEMIWMVRVMMWAMSPLGLAYILLNFELAQHRFKPAVSLLCCAVLYVVLAGKWHDSVFQIAAVLAGVSVLALALLVLGLPWAGGSEKARDSRKDSSSDWKGSQLPG
jgi:O-antigen/teichoic acid export membrane protein